MNKVNVALSAALNKNTVEVSEAYLNAIWQSGGIPSVLPARTDKDFLSAVADVFDGFVFCGGGDIDPKYYGEENIASKNICSKRDEFEKALFEVAIAAGKPILGICRGMQAANVFLGGSLHQHIDGHLQTEPRSTQTHAVTLAREGLLAGIENEEIIKVNSFHHQVIKRLACGLEIDAISSEDGYIEAFHAPEHGFLLGVQWHPEAYYRNDESARAIFNAFVDACR